MFPKKKKYIPCFCITVKNLIITFEDGLIKTWRLPVFSALLMAFKASAKTEVLVMVELSVDKKKPWKGSIVKNRLIFFFFLLPHCNSSKHTSYNWWPAYYKSFWKNFFPCIFVILSLFLTHSHLLMNERFGVYKLH